MTRVLPLFLSVGVDNDVDSGGEEPRPQASRYRRRPREEEAEDGVSNESIDDLFKSGCCKAGCIRSHNKKDLRRLRKKWL